MFIIELLICFVLGLITGIHFMNRNTYIYKAPSSSSVKNKIHYDKKTGTCYKLVPKVYICPIKYSMKH
jgi:hypothetical protein